MAATVVTASPGDTVDVFGVRYTATDYRRATERIMHAARRRESFGVSALAVHGLMEATRDATLMRQVNRIDLVVPDGQPVRWAMNVLHRTRLKDRVYGPELSWHVAEAAAAERIPIYLFGSTPDVCAGYASAIRARYPGAIVHAQPDRFREATPAEDAADVERIHASGAGVVLVGRGCPRQERWVADHLGRVDAALLAVGAAFDFGAGVAKEAPAWMQRAGLQWLHRMASDPRRLWKRYLVTNTRFLVRFARELARTALRPTARGSGDLAPRGDGR